MKAIGSAVLTALQSKDKPIEEVADLINKRRYKANLRGTTTAEWVDAFWSQVGLMQSAVFDKRSTQ